jgi:type III restriction enzyme
LSDERRFNNQDLVLNVSNNIDPNKFDITLYESFIDELCGTREYQKIAIRTVMNYFLGDCYGSLRDLALKNYNENPILQERYTIFREMESHLQFPDKLSCSVDLATATGKSFVMYGIARIMLCHGVIDRVLVLCPSLTIEKGLTKKFFELSSDFSLTELLPEQSIVKNPHIINGTDSIIGGSICIENFHAAMENSKSSIRSSLAQKGRKTLILNDEAHHVYNAVNADTKKWKEFLSETSFGFHYLAGFSGTCYIGNEYFNDVISRYSLRQAMDQGLLNWSIMLRKMFVMTNMKDFKSCITIMT